MSLLSCVGVYMSICMGFLYTYNVISENDRDKQASTHTITRKEDCLLKDQTWKSIGLYQEAQENKGSHVKENGIPENTPKKTKTESLQK